MDTSCTGRDWAHDSLVYREGGYEKETDTNWFLALDLSEINIFAELGEYPEQIRKEWSFLQNILACEGNRQDEWALFVGKGKTTDTDRSIRTRVLRNIINRIARKTWTPIYFFCFLAKTANNPRITALCVEVAREKLSEFRQQIALCGDVFVRKCAEEWMEQFLTHINAVPNPPKEEPVLPGYIRIPKYR